MEKILFVTPGERDSKYGYLTVGGVFAIHDLANTINDDVIAERIAVFTSNMPCAFLSAGILASRLGGKLINNDVFWTHGDFDDDPESAFRIMEKVTGYDLLIVVTEKCFLCELLEYTAEKLLGKKFPCEELPDAWGYKIDIKRKILTLVKPRQLS